MKIEIQLASNLGVDKTSGFGVRLSGGGREQ